MLVTLDFETYSNPKTKYDPKHISLVEYIRSPQFHVQGVGIKYEAGRTEWISAPDVKKSFDGLDWDEVILIGHNLKFDASILAWQYGIYPKEYRDTKALSKAIIGPQIPTASLKHTAQFLGLEDKGSWEAIKMNGVRDPSPEQEKALAEYCKLDADLSWGIYQKLAPEFPEVQWPIMDWTIRTFVQPQLKIKSEICTQLSDEIKQGKQALFSQAGIDREVFASNKKFPELLENEGFTVPYKENKKGKRIPALSLTDKEFLLMCDSENPRLRLLCECRKAAKSVLEEKRAEKLAHIGGMADYSFDVGFSGATQTHRFSGGNGCAGNPQNFTKGSPLRSAIYV